MSNLSIVPNAVTTQRALLQQRLEQERIAQRERKQADTRARVQAKLERERLEATQTVKAAGTDRERLMARLASEKREGDRLTELSEQIRVAKRETEQADLRARLELAKQTIGGGVPIPSSNEQRAAALRAKLDSSKREEQMASLRERLTARRVQAAGA